MATATAEESSKRMAGKLRKAEHSAEEALKRLSKLEDELRARGFGGPPRDGFMEARVGALEQQTEQLDDLLRNLQAQVDEGMPGLGDLASDEGADAGLGGARSDLEEAVRATERSVADLERKVMKQVEEQASFRVKVDHQLSRVGTLADRMETAHEPALESLRSELAGQRAQDRQHLDGEVAALRRRMQESAEGAEDALAEVRESLRRGQAEAAVSTLRPEEGAAAAVRQLADNLLAFEARLEALEELPPAQEGGMMPVRSGDLDAEGGGGGPDGADGQDIEEIRGRLEWLEEQSASRAAERPDQRQAADAQEKIYKILERLSCLEQQASRGEMDKVHQQIQQLQDAVERRQAEDLSGSRSSVETDAKVGVVSQQVAQLAARLSEVESNLDFARESGEGAGRLDTSGASETPTGGGRPPLPSGDRGLGLQEIQEKLVNVAEHLEVVDELTERVMALEHRLAGADDPPAHRLENESPAKHSEVSFGGDAPIKGQSAGGAAREVEELRAELQAVRRELREELSRRDLAEEQLKGRAKRSEEQHEALTERVGSFAAESQALAEQLQELSEAAGEAKEARGRADDVAGKLKELQAARGEPDPEVRAGLEALKARVEALPSKADLEVVETKVSEVAAKVGLTAERSESAEELQKRVDELGEQVAALDRAREEDKEAAASEKKEPGREDAGEASSALRAEVDDLRGRLEEFQEDEMGALREDLARATTSVKDLASKLSQVQDEAARPAAEAWKEPLEIQQKSLDEMKSKLEGIQGQQDSLEELRERLKELEGNSGSLDDIKSKLEGLEGKRAPDEDLGGLAESVQDIREQLDGLREKVDGGDKKDVGAADQLTELEQSSGKRLDELQAALEKAKEELKDELGVLAKRADASEERAAESAAQPARGADLQKLEADLKAAASRLDEVAEGQRAAQEAQDSQRTSAGALSEKVEAALGRLGELEGSHVEAEGRALAASKRLDEIAGRLEEGSGKATSSEAVVELEAKLAAKIEAVEERLASMTAGEAAPASATAGSAADAKVREEVQERMAEIGSQLEKELQALARHQQELEGAKGTVSSATSAAVQDRLDLLDRQVGELRLQMGAARAGLARAEEPLDYSLTGASEMRGTAASPGEEPLDFSLTEASKMDGSLNFSLTEASRMDGSEMDSSGRGARGVGIGGAGSGATPARSRPAPLKIESEDKSMPLSPVKEGSVSEEKAQASGGKEAEQQDALSALMSDKSTSSKRSPPAAASPAAHSPLGDTPAKSPGGSDQLAMSMQSNLSAVSQSGNEVSVGADYSVEDSTELEKCDYFEAVEPSSGAQDESPSSNKDGAGDALDSILGGGRPRPTPLKPMGQTPVSEALKSSASVDTVIHRSPEAAKSPAGAASPGPAQSPGAAQSPGSASASAASPSNAPPPAAPAAASPSSRGGGGQADGPPADEYGDESFDDEDMSIPESIPSGDEGSASDEV